MEKRQVFFCWCKYCSSFWVRHSYVLDFQNQTLCRWRVWTRSLWMEPKVAHGDFQLHPRHPLLESRLAGAAGVCDWVRASQAEPKSITAPVLAERGLHFIITNSYRKWWATCYGEGVSVWLSTFVFTVWLHSSMCAFCQLRLLPIVIICKSWHLLSTRYGKCVRASVCVLWLDPSLRGWRLITWEHSRACMTGKEGKRCKQTMGERGVIA